MDQHGGAFRDAEGRQSLQSVADAVLPRRAADSRGEKACAEIVGQRRDGGLVEVAVVGVDHHQSLGVRRAAEQGFERAGEHLPAGEFAILLRAAERRRARRAPPRRPEKPRRPFACPLSGPCAPAFFAPEHVARIRSKVKRRALSLHALSLRRRKKLAKMAA